MQPPPPPAQARFTFAENDAARFWAFHQENPHVYNTEIETQGDPFKVNNTFRARYARLLMRQEPALAGVFETRRSDADEAL